MPSDCALLRRLMSLLTNKTSFSRKNNAVERIAWSGCLASHSAGSKAVYSVSWRMRDEVASNWRMAARALTARVSSSLAFKPSTCSGPDGEQPEYHLNEDLAKVQGFPSERWCRTLQRGAHSQPGPACPAPEDSNFPLFYSTHPRGAMMYLKRGNAQLLCAKRARHLMHLGSGAHIHLAITRRLQRLIANTPVNILDCFLNKLHWLL